MKVKKIIGIIFLVVGVIGFFYFANQKNERKIFQERVSSPELKTLNIDLEQNQTYEIKFWGVDEQMTGVFDQAYFEADISIKNIHGHILFNQSLISIHEVETGGKRVTHDGVEYIHTPKTDENIQIELKIIKGDYIDIEVYKNMDSETDALPGISIIFALIGLVLFLRNRKN